MIPAYPRALVRSAESALVAEAVSAGDPDHFMRSAARAVADAVLDALGDDPRSHGSPAVLALAGGGDNGGDALYAASFLAESGIPCIALGLHERIHERASAAAREAGVEILRAPVPGARTDSDDTAEQDDAVASRASPGSGSALVPALADDPRIAAALRAGVWIDGILGTGLEGAPREPARSWIRELEDVRRARGARVVAVDVPSGALSDEGAVTEPVLAADRTVTMGGLKSALVLPPALHRAGAVSVHDLGLDLPESDVRVVEDADVAEVLGVPGPSDHKYTRGVAGLVAGSDSYPGAGVLACLGAQAAGPGMIRLDAPGRVEDLALSRIPGIVTEGGRIQAGLVGPGMDETREQSVRDLARFCLSSGLPLVIDAGALALVPEFARTRLADTCVLTPHAGEAAALLSALGELRPRWWIEENPAEAARIIASATGARVLLKGAACVLASPDGSLVAIPAGLGWTGVAGAGDVLAGLLTGLAATWRARVESDRPHVDFATVLAVGALLHARAGALAARRYGPLGAPIGAHEIAEALPAVIGRLLAGADGAAEPVGY